MMGHVQAGAGELLRQLHVALHDRSLGRRLHAAQAQAKRGRAVVHGAAIGHARIFRVLNHRKIDFGRQAQRFAHHCVAENGLAVVGDGHRARALQTAKVRQHRPFAGMSGGGDRKDVDHGAALRPLQPGDPFRRIDNGLRVGHAADGSESSGSSGGGAGGDGFLVTLPGLAQVNMQIDEAGSDDQPARVEFLVRGAANLARRRDLGHLPIAQQDVHGRIDLGGGIDKRARP